MFELLAVRSTQGLETGCTAEKASLDSRQLYKEAEGEWNGLQLQPRRQTVSETAAEKGWSITALAAACLLCSGE